MPITDSDVKFLQAAGALAARGMYATTPNPSVGCLLVKDTRIVGRGWTQKPGGNHAEVQALLDAQANDEKLAGATVYVSLEPCCFQGRTPACTEALVNAGVKRVVVAMLDPNPQVCGHGIQALEAAGIECALVELGLDSDLNVGYHKRMHTKRPWVRVKSAMSLDARTAMASGESQWITGEVARSDVQHWRARSCAVVTGVGTVLADNPRLTVREKRFAFEGVVRQPLKVVLDSELRSTPEAGIYSTPGDSVVVTLLRASDERRKAFTKLPNTKLLIQDGEHIQLSQLLDDLAAFEINEVLVEAGAQLTGAFYTQALWDEALVYMAPKLLGRTGRALAEFSIDRMSDALNVEFLDVTRLGQDLRIRVLRNSQTN